MCQEEGTCSHHGVRADDAGPGTGEGREDTFVTLDRMYMYSRAAALFCHLQRERVTVAAVTPGERKALIAVLSEEHCFITPSSSECHRLQPQLTSWLTVAPSGWPLHVVGSPSRM